MIKTTRPNTRTCKARNLQILKFSLCIIIITDKASMNYFQLVKKDSDKLQTTASSHEKLRLDHSKAGVATFESSILQNTTKFTEPRPRFKSLQLTSI
jgi:hypothetical protein